MGVKKEEIQQNTMKWVASRLLKQGLIGKSLGSIPIDRNHELFMGISLRDNRRELKDYELEEFTTYAKDSNWRTLFSVLVETVSKKRKRFLSRLHIE